MIDRTRLGALSITVALALATACTTKGVSPAAEPPADLLPPVRPAELSRFSVPVQYDFSSMLRVVERVVPTTFGSIDSIRMIGTDARRHYAFEATRGPFTAFAAGRELHLRASIAYRAEGFYKPPIGPTMSAGCGGARVGERPRLVVELAAPLTLTPDWHLRSHSRLVSLAPASDESRDRCDVTLLRRDITPRVVEAARAALLGRLSDIDERVAQVDLHDQFTEWWGLLTRPIPLTDGVWLLLGPERLRMGTVSGRERVLTIPVSVDARPRIVASAAAPRPDSAPLPPLGQGASGDGFHIAMDGILDYAAAGRALQAAIAGRTMVEAGRKLMIRKVSVAPAPRGRLELRVAFTGDASGSLRFVGTPAYDASSGMLAVPDLDYDLDVNDPLVNGYVWLRSDLLRAAFREKARVPVRPVLAHARELLLQGLNRKLGDAVTLSATVDSVAVRGLAVTRDGLVVRAEASGRASMAVRQR
jgi:hypothetical protein